MLKNNNITHTHTQTQTNITHKSNKKMKPQYTGKHRFSPYKRGQNTLMTRSKPFKGVSYTNDEKRDVKTLNNILEYHKAVVLHLESLSNTYINGKDKLELYSNFCSKLAKPTEVKTPDIDEVTNNQPFVSSSVIEEDCTVIDESDLCEEIEQELTDKELEKIVERENKRTSIPNYVKGYITTEGVEVTDAVVDKLVNLNWKNENDPVYGPMNKMDNIYQACKRLDICSWKHGSAARPTADNIDIKTPLKEIDNQEIYNERRYENDFKESLEPRLEFAYETDYDKINKMGRIVVWNEMCHKINGSNLVKTRTKHDMDRYNYHYKQVHCSKCAEKVLFEYTDVGLSKIRFIVRDCKCGKLHDPRDWNITLGTKKIKFDKTHLTELGNTVQHF